MDTKTGIVYVSTHHGNTKKLLDAIAEQNPVELVDVTANEQYNLSGYDRIGIASGVAYGKYYPQMLKFLENNLPVGGINKYHPDDEEIRQAIADGTFLQYGSTLI